MGPEVSAKFDDACFEASRPQPSPPRPGTTMLGNSAGAVDADEDEPHESVLEEVPRGLTNEVQRRAKRVRCNAGLGCWCPHTACSLRSLGPLRCTDPTAEFEVLMIGVRRTRGEGADVGATNLDGYLHVWEPWWSARRGCEMGLRRGAGAGGLEPGFRDERGIPTLPTHPRDSESGTPLRYRDLERSMALCPIPRRPRRA